MPLYNEHLCRQLVELQRAIPQFVASTPRYLISSGFSVALFLEREHRLLSDIDPFAFDEVVGGRLIQTGYRDTFYPPYRMPSGLKASPDFLRDSSLPASFNFGGREYPTRIVHPAVTVVQKARQLLWQPRSKDSLDLTALFRHQQRYPSETGDWDQLIAFVASKQEGLTDQIKDVVKKHRIVP